MCECRLCMLKCRHTSIQRQNLLVTNNVRQLQFQFQEYSLEFQTVPLEYKRTVLRRQNLTILNNNIIKNILIIIILYSKILDSFSCVDKAVNLESS